MEIYAKFIDIQRNLPPLVKDTQGHGYKYPTLNQLLDIVLPMCHERGLGLTQITHPVTGGGVGVETVLFNEANEKMSSGILAMPLTTDQNGNIINVGNVNKQGNVSGQYGAQAYGSALSYARRYSLTAFFGMKAEDDDGHQAAQPRRKVEEKPQQSEEPKLKPLNMIAFEKSMRESKDIETLNKFYQIGMARATKEQVSVINSLYEQLKAIHETKE